MATKNGLLLSLEGIDFTWKTPFSEWLSKDCSEKMLEVVITRDPPYSLAPWNHYKEFFEKGEVVAHLAEAMMLLAARLDNYERLIKPALSRGALVISDRYIDSWLAYQSVRLSKYFGGSKNAVLNFLLNLNRQMVEQEFLAMPDLTILISDNPEKTIQRKNTEKEISKYDVLEIQKQVHEQYKILTKLFPERTVAVDVEEKDIHKSYEIVKTIALSWLRGCQKGNKLFLSTETVKSGQRIMALRTLSWTIGKFDDYPLIVVSGDKGTIKYSGHKSIIVEWDNDEFRRFKKAVNLESEERFSCIALY